MRMSRYIFVGILLGFTLFKTEAVSFFRIFEMFHFQAFHMYGIIGTSVVAGMLMVYVIRQRHVKSLEGKEIEFPPKAKTYKRYIVGGFIFGLGWALAGICPAPMFILLGSGYTVLIVFLASAMFGTYLYGVLRPKLPH